MSYLDIADQANQLLLELEAAQAMGHTCIDLEDIEDHIRDLRAAFSVPTPNWPEGRVIVKKRPMSVAEHQREDWGFVDHSTVLDLGDQGVIYASRDSEGNGPGLLFGVDDSGTTVYIMAKKEVR